MMNGAPALHADLARFLDQVEQARQYSSELMTGLSDRQVNWRPDPARWSIGENLDHLVVVGAQYLDVIDGMLADARTDDRFTLEPVRYGIGTRFLIRSMEPPVSVPVRTPRTLRPGPAHDPQALQRAFESLQDFLELRIREANASDLNGIRARSPILPVLRMSLGQWFAFLLAHQRRHLWAAFRVKEDNRFPTG